MWVDSHAECKPFCDIQIHVVDNFFRRHFVRLHIYMIFFVCLVINLDDYVG